MNVDTLREETAEKSEMTETIPLLKYCPEIYFNQNYKFIKFPFSEKHLIPLFDRKWFFFIPHDLFTKLNTFASDRPRLESCR